VEAGGTYREFSSPSSYRESEPSAPIPQCSEQQATHHALLVQACELYAQRGKGEGVEICSVPQPRSQDSWGQTAT